MRARHREAIKAFLVWDEKHPEADRHRRNAQFDALVDSAALQIELQRELRKSKVVHAK